MNEKTYRNQVLEQESHQCDKHLGCPPCNILDTVLQVDEGKTSTVQQKANDKA